MPTFLNTMNNALLRAALLNSESESGNAAAYGITLINHPMVGTNARLSTEKILQGTDVLIAMFIVIAMSFVPASFVLFLVTERYIKSRHLQVKSDFSLIFCLSPEPRPDLKGRYFISFDPRAQL